MEANRLDTALQPLINKAAHLTSSIEKTHRRKNWWQFENSCPIQSEHFKSYKQLNEELFHLGYDVSAEDYFYETYNIIRTLKLEVNQTENLVKSKPNQIHFCSISSLEFSEEHIYFDNSTLDFHALPQISKPLPSININLIDVTIPQDITFVDPEFHKPGSIEFSTIYVQPKLTLFL